MYFSSEQPRIIVVGSSSIDLVLETEKLPLPNETVLAVNSESYFGGKGAIQIGSQCIFHRLCRDGSSWSADYEKSGE
jgi:hypothetical protein